MNPPPPRWLHFRVLATGSAGVYDRAGHLVKLFAGPLAQELAAAYIIGADYGRRATEDEVSGVIAGVIGTLEGFR